MRFDDRLQTMIDAPVADSRDRAVRWRQLVDLLSRSDPRVVSEAAARAIEIVRRDAPAVDEAVRGATLRAIAGRALPDELLRVLAGQPLPIAAPLFAGMTLGAAQAADVLAEASDELRALVRIKTSPPSDSSEPAPRLIAPDSQAPVPGARAERSERVRHDHAPAPRPAAGGARLFEWESDPSGQIAWVEGAPRGALVGRPLGGDGVGLIERPAAARLDQRHPFVDVPLAVEGMLEGEWSGTGVPAFDPATGRFLGYRGLARRIDGAVPGTAVEREPDLDALRELVHEIKTPLNAIIGFAEIIDGQYLGPAHARYRERAASIVGQARQLLEAVEDLDFAAKLRAERARGQSVGPASALSQLFPPIAAELEACLGVNGGVLEVHVDDERHRCALSAELVARLLRRLLMSLCTLVGKGEVFRLAVTRRGAMCVLTIARPHALAGLDETRLVDPSFCPMSGDGGGGQAENGVGLGFALRLVRGLARVAGGALLIEEQRITLEFPAAEG